MMGDVGKQVPRRGYTYQRDGKTIVVAPHTTTVHPSDPGLDPSVLRHRLGGADPFAGDDPAPDDPSSDEVVFRLALSDLDPGDVGRLWHLGARGPQMVRAVLDGGGTVGDVAAYTTAGVVTAADLAAHRKANISAAAALALHRAGYTSPVAQRRWRRTRAIGRGHRALWFQAGVLSAGDIDALEAAGIDAQEAVRYATVQPMSPTEMIRLRALNVLPQFVSDYQANGVGSVNDMVWLAQRGVRHHEITGLASRGVTDPRDMAILVQAGVSFLAIEHYRSGEVHDAGEIARLHRAGISGHVARRYAHDGVDDPDAMIERWQDPDDPLRWLHDRHYDPHTAWFDKLERYGVTDTGDAVRLIHLGYDSGHRCLIDDLLASGWPIDDIVGHARRGVHADALRASLDHDQRSG